MMLTILRKLSRQRGAMFSMDARIALIIASVLAGVVGTQVIQRIERNRVAAAEEGVQQLLSGLETYYKTVSLSALPPGNPDTFNTGTNNFESVIVDAGLVTQNNLNTDSWGNVWTYETCSAAATIEGTPVTVHYVVLYSSGPDGVADSGTGDILTTPACATNYASWTTAGDDVGEKFSTFDIERQRVQLTNQRLRALQDALGAYESSHFMENQTFCSVLANQTTTPRCDFLNDGYVTGEEVILNYFPRSVNDGLDSGTSPNDFYYIPYGRAAAGAEMGEVTNSLSDMQDFVVLLGLSADYAQDPWGRILCYESNRTDNTRAPFTVKLEYNNTCPTP